LAMVRRRDMGEDKQLHRNSRNREVGRGVPSAPGPRYAAGNGAEGTPRPTFAKEFENCCFAALTG
jgi:hypothetical protein